MAHFERIAKKYIHRLSLTGSIRPGRNATYKSRPKDILSEETANPHGNRFIPPHSIFAPRFLRLLHTHMQYPHQVTTHHQVPHKNSLHPLTQASITAMWLL